MIPALRYMPANLPSCLSTHTNCTHPPINLFRSPPSTPLSNPSIHQPHPPTSSTPPIHPSTHPFPLPSLHPSLLAPTLLSSSIAPPPLPVLPVLPLLSPLPFLSFLFFSLSGPPRFHFHSHLRPLTLHYMSYIAWLFFSSYSIFYIYFYPSIIVVVVATTTINRELGGRGGEGRGAQFFFFMKFQLGNIISTHTLHPSIHLSIYLRDAQHGMYLLYVLSE